MSQWDRGTKKLAPPAFIFRDVVASPDLQFCKDSLAGNHGVAILFHPRGGQSTSQHEPSGKRDAQNLVKSSVGSRIELVPALHKLLDPRGPANSIEEGPMVATSLKAEIAETRNGIPTAWKTSLIAIALSLLFILLALILGPFPALAGERIRRPVLPNSDATLYEVTETVRFDVAAGLSVTMRDAIATLMGSARLGTPLCPAEVLLTNAAVRTCEISGQGQDSVSLATGLGPCGASSPSSSTPQGTVTTMSQISRS
jgi:hypothetical protein